MKKCAIALLLAAVLALTGCGHGAIYSADSAFTGWDAQVHEEMTGQSEDWYYTMSRERYPMECLDDDGRVLAEGSYDLPRVRVFHADGSPYQETQEPMAAAVTVARRFNSYFADWLAVQRQNYGEICRLAQEHYALGGEAWQNAEYRYTDTVQTLFWSNDHIACITLLAESFTGGAHSVRSRTALTFDMHSGLPITINDMVADYAGLRDAVALEILGQIADGKYVKYYDGQLFDGYEDTITQWMSRSVFFGEEGMTVVFGTYDIAPYSAGEQAFHIPYDLAAPYLNDYGKTVLEMGE